MILSFLISIPFMIAKEGAKWSQFVTTFNTNPIVSFNLIASGLWFYGIYAHAHTHTQTHTHTHTHTHRARTLERFIPSHGLGLWLLVDRIRGREPAKAKEQRRVWWRGRTSLMHTNTGYNELATMTIKKTNAVTQSVANTAKRVIVIVGVAIVLGTLAAFYFLSPDPKPAHMRSRIRMLSALFSPCGVGTWGARSVGKRASCHTSLHAL